MTATAFVTWKIDHTTLGNFVMLRSLVSHKGGLEAPAKYTAMVEVSYVKLRAT